MTQKNRIHEFVQKQLDASAEVSGSAMTFVFGKNEKTSEKRDFKNEYKCKNQSTEACSSNEIRCMNAATYCASSKNEYDCKNEEKAQ